jgi:hypothetical protein
MKAYELLSDRSKWTQNYAARDKDNKNVSPHDSSAVKFCLIGALRKCYNDGWEYTEARNKVHDAANRPLSLSTLNDTSDYNYIWNLLRSVDV